jgi:hypothetical protein
MVRRADPEFVTRVMRDPRVWKWVAEDGIVPEQFQHRSSETYFQFRNLGFVMFRRPTMTMAEIHVCMLKGARGIEPFIFECMEMMRAKGVRKFLAPIGDWNVAALRLARRCGYKEEGRITAAYVRDGKPRAMVMMGRR